MTDRTELRRQIAEAIYIDSGRSFGWPTYAEALCASPHDLAKYGRRDGVTAKAYAENSESNAAAVMGIIGPRLDQLDAAEAALARVWELHERWPIHGDGDHPEDCDCGDPWVTVCRLCCTDGEDQHETCAVYHDHGPDKPICPTIAALGGEQS